MSTSRDMPSDDPPGDVEADPADVADQQLPADPELESDETGLADTLPDEADPADVADQRREVPPEPEE